MKKRFLFVLFCSVFIIESFSQDNKSIEKFIKGNISDKTAALREAEGNESVWLSNQAITFVLQSHELLGKDREIDALAVAAILSMPNEYVSKSSDTVRDIILINFINLFSDFKDSGNVQIAVISKVTSLMNYLDIDQFILMLNNYLAAANLNTADESVIKSALNLLSLKGDNNSFVTIYNIWASKKYSKYNADFEKTLVSLLPVSTNEAIAITQASISQATQFYDLLIQNKAKINENSLAVVSENILSSTIVYMNTSSEVSEDILKCQIEAIKILKEAKWTRSAVTVLSFFNIAKNLYTDNKLKTDIFIDLIESLMVIAPYGAVTPLISFLEELNTQAANGTKINEPLMLAVIKTLGAIGDKSAFDSLLSITYCDNTYSQEVLASAQKALLELKW